ncbi:MAG: ABC transporter ATP-binding protein [Nanoarchaeota archaeon]|nr:ABC transporter ATP-binding protein [Nanoarchaeota archaeon]
MLKIKQVTKNFGGVRALDKCSLEIEKEKIIAIIGPNGSGKSTLFNVISNLIKKDSGRIYLDKEDITEKEDFNIAKLGISRTFQEVRLFRNLTIKDHLEIALLESDEKLIRSLFGKREDNEKRIKDILNLVGFDKPLDTHATELSYGQRKLLDLAIAIAKPHKILMLDEPVAGVNPKLRKGIKEILRKLRKKGDTILIIEHDMNFVMDLADYVFVLDYGKVIAHGTPRKIQNNKKVLEAYLGE